MLLSSASSLKKRKKKRERRVGRKRGNDSSGKIRISESCKQDLTICGGCGRWTGANVARVSSPSLSLSPSPSFSLYTVPQFSVCFTLTKNNGICFRGCCRISAWKSIPPPFTTCRCARVHIAAVQCMQSRENYNVVWRSNRSRGTNCWESLRIKKKKNEKRRRDIFSI